MSRVLGGLVVPLEGAFLRRRWLAGRVPVGTFRMGGSVEHPVCQAQGKFEHAQHVEVHLQLRVFGGLDFLIANATSGRATPRCQQNVALAAWSGTCVQFLLSALGKEDNQ
jgi:hypothetical protein